MDGKDTKIQDKSLQRMEILHANSHHEFQLFLLFLPFSKNFIFTRLW